MNEKVNENYLSRFTRKERDKFLWTICKINCPFIYKNMNLETFTELRENVEKKTKEKEETERKCQTCNKIKKIESFKKVKFKGKFKILTHCIPCQKEKDKKYQKKYRLKKFII